MNNNINTLINSLSNLGEIRKADKNNGEYSSTSDNTMAVGTRMFDKRLIIPTQVLVDALTNSLNTDSGKDNLYWLHGGPLYFIDDVYRSLGGVYGANYVADRAYIKQKIIKHPDFFENHYKNIGFTFFFDAENYTFKFLEKEFNLLTAIENIVIKQHRCLYHLKLSIPSKVDILTMQQFSISNNKIEENHAILYTLFSPFQYSVDTLPKDFQYQKASKDFSKGTFYDLIKNGRIQIYKLVQPSNPSVNNMKWDDIFFDIWKNKIKLQYGKDFYLDSETTELDFNHKFPVSCFNFDTDFYGNINCYDSCVDKTKLKTKIKGHSWFLYKWHCDEILAFLDSRKVWDGWK